MEMKRENNQVIINLVHILVTATVTAVGGER